jgi:hypothetical protein
METHDPLCQGFLGFDEMPRPGPKTKRLRMMV